MRDGLAVFVARKPFDPGFAILEFADKNFVADIQLHL